MWIEAVGFPSISFHFAAVMASHATLVHLLCIMVWIFGTWLCFTPVYVHMMTCCFWMFGDEHLAGCACELLNVWLRWWCSFVGHGPLHSCRPAQPLPSTISPQLWWRWFSTFATTSLGEFLLHPYPHPCVHVCWMLKFKLLDILCSLTVSFSMCQVECSTLII
jgi:hypothetical protein